MMSLRRPTLSLFLFMASLAPAMPASFDEIKFNALVTKLKADAFEFASEVERLYVDRCSDETINTCSGSNFGECLEDGYPNEECLGGPNYVIEDCASEQVSSCAAKWDQSVSTVRIPEESAIGLDGNPTDPKLIESICFTRNLDDWFVQKREADKAFWNDLGVEPRSMYFGSHNGAFRIFPARQSEQCGQYDPRLRPWYVSGSSGPKNVVLILDTSGSMAEGNRIDLLKQAAKRVVSTLTVSDRILIVPFSDTAYPITDDGVIFRATASHKARLMDMIDGLSAVGGTNFYEAFRVAFDNLDKSIVQESTTSCNTAVLFLTDGENSVGPGVDQVTELVDRRISEVSSKLGKEVILFTYSVSQQNNVHQYPSQLACSIDLGVWSKIEESDEIVDALSSYYRLFALGLGSDANADFASWVEPYEFRTGNVLGTTVSVPVYDRSKIPHLFLGVVGVDVSLDALDAALLITDDLDGTSSSARAKELRDESIDRVVKQADAACPAVLDLTPCEMEAYRALSAPNGEGLCNVNCTSAQVSQVQEESCPTVSDYPQRVFVSGSQTYGGEFTSGSMRYRERVCCVGDESLQLSAEVCWAGKDDDKRSSLPGGAIVGIVLGGVFFLLIIGCVVMAKVCKDKDSPGRPNNHASGNINSPNYPPENPGFAPIPPGALVTEASAPGSDGTNNSPESQ
eukprot:CAMPEP_0172452664 /NCGR_PEP_ID=MMETSP1065-20121228/10246_1 /TAXON_ID=265537 /ORGANISM="Amphiprora paludosa, Strain CCMP125" /LENGTH=683 /DNA_ID=CAMNT_0013204755 /DNA_START=144 /DNA_END=2195 /DNA_ORIENTATION=+